MRKIKGVICVASIAIFATSCTKELFTKDVIENHEIRHIAVDAALPKSGNTNKAYLDPAAGLKVKWEAGDTLGINGVCFTTNTLINDNTTACFHNFYGVTPLHTNNDPSIDDVYWAVYPHNIRASATVSQLTVNFPSVQTFNSTHRRLQDYNFMAGYASVAPGTENLTIQMRNLGAVVAIALKPASGNTSAENNVSSIEFSCSTTWLSGQFTVSNNTSNPTISAPSTPASYNTLTVNVNQGNNPYHTIASQNANDTVYVILPPTIRTTDELTMRVFNTYGWYTEKKVTGLQLLRNHFYVSEMANVAFDRPPYFSINSNGGKVVCSPGNLQFKASSNGTAGDLTHHVATGGTANGQWRFAPNQWDIIGSANYNISATYTDWVDLFAWGTSGWNSGATQYQPWAYTDHGSQNQYYPGGSPTNDLTGTYANGDWGIFNEIYNTQTSSLDSPGTWRLLTYDEWTYIMKTRATRSNLHFAKGRIHGRNGLILIPDKWTGLHGSFSSADQDNVFFSTNNISDANWAEMEKAGCVFLPAAGARFDHGTDYTNGWQFDEFGYYWMSTHNQYVTATAADRACFSDDYTDFYYPPNGGTNNVGNRHRGESVRLVKVVQ